ncbi:MAG TPA: hypothetical protein VK162_21665 [Streptosporangiaceae bacterium]|nr:hypothetical protein [Streptosporangiaceae bacterium]
MPRLGPAGGGPVVRRILLVDAPSVLGWDRWRALEERHGLGLIKGALGGDRRRRWAGTGTGRDLLPCPAGHDERDRPLRRPRERVGLCDDIRSGRHRGVPGPAPRRHSATSTRGAPG